MHLSSVPVTGMLYCMLKETCVPIHYNAEISRIIFCDVSIYIMCA